MSNQLKGFREERLHQKDVYGVYLNVAERWMAHIFNEEFDEEELERIIKHPRGYLTDDEKLVAVTMIQWMGTNVGRNLIDRVFEKADKQIDVLGELRTKLHKSHQRKHKESLKTNRDADTQL